MAARYTIAESPFQRMLSYVTTVILWFLGFVFSVVVFWFSRMFVARQLLNVTDVGQRATTGKLCKLSPGGNQKEWWTVEVSDLWQLWSQVVQFLKVNSSIQKSHLCLCPYVTVHHLPYTMTPVRIFNLSSPNLSSAHLSLVTTTNLTLCSLCKILINSRSLKLSSCNNKT